MTPAGTGRPVAPALSCSSSASCAVKKGLPPARSWMARTSPSAHLAGRGLPDERRGVLDVEPREPQAPAAATARDRGEHADELVAAAEVDLPHRRQQQDGLVDEVRCQVADQLQRRGVGPLQVVEQDHHLTGRAGAPQRRRHGLHGGVGTAAGGLPSAGVEQRHEPRLRLVRGVVAQRAQHGQPRPEGGGGPALVGASPQDERAAVARDGGDLLQQPGLADAGLALDDAEAGGGAALLEHRQQDGELAAAADEPAVPPSARPRSRAPAGGRVRRSSAGSCRSTCSSSSRSAWPGSTPSSSTRLRRASASARSASACCPDR